jgi:hypothetical protein
MLTPFPELLVYQFYAPTIVRIVAGLAFLFVAYLLYHRRHELAHAPLPVIGRAPWFIWIAAVVQGAIGFALLFGYYTQIAALVGMLISLKGVVFAKRFPKLYPLCRLEFLFILAICASLMLSGAGALAFDQPL